MVQAFHHLRAQGDRDLSKDQRHRLLAADRLVHRLAQPEPVDHHPDHQDQGATPGPPSAEATFDAGFDVHEGEIFVILGLSGSGKSTLVRCLSPPVDADHEGIRLDGQNPRAASPRELIEIRRHKMAMTFQGFGLLPHLTALENTAFPLKLQGMAKAEREARAMKMIRRQIQDEFLRLQAQLKKTIVFITHDIMEACRLADRIALMRGGMIIQIGTPAEILLSPADPYVAEFTAEVALTRVIRAGDLANPSPAPDAPEIDADTPLEGLMARIAAGHDLFNLRPAAVRLLSGAGSGRSLGAPGVRWPPGWTCPCAGCGRCFNSCPDFAIACLALIANRLLRDWR